MGDWSQCSWKLDESATPNEVALKSQLLERKEELEQLFQFMKEFCGDKPTVRGAMKDYAIKLQPSLVKAFWSNIEGGSSGNAVKED